MKNLTRAFPLVLLVACNAGPSDIISKAPVNQAQGYIIGGEPTTGYPAVVALYAREPGADAGSLCTATVVSPTVVLTAAHCVHPDLVGEKAVFEVLTGADLTDANNPTPRLAVASVDYDPEFSETALQNGHDIAVAILAEPTDIAPIKINRAPLTEDMEDQPARIIGYGLNQGFPQKGAGIKRTAMVELNSYSDLFVKTGGWDARICNGDSGGPVLMNIDGEDQVVGVNSYGMIFCLGQGSSTRVDAYPEFLDKHLAQ